MSNVPAVQGQGADVARREHQDRLVRGLDKLRTDAQFLAGSQLLSASYRLDRDRRPRPKEEVMADVMVVLLDAQTRGLPTTVSTINKYAVINGAAIPMGQLLIGLVARHGHDLWIEERSDDKAVVILRNARTGRAHRVEYTMAEAKVSASYKKSVALGIDKSVWLSHPADMLVWRAVNRAVRIGAPDIAAGFGLPEGYEDAAPGPAYEWDRDPAEMGERPELPSPQVVEQVKDAGRRVIRLRGQIKALPDAWRRPLGLAWQAKKIPPLDHEDILAGDWLDTAEDIVDAITAEAFKLPPEADTTPGEGEHPDPPSQTAHAASPAAGAVGAEAPRAVVEGDEAGLRADRRVQGQPPSSEPARPLAQQIAMQAQQAGLDRAHVIYAVTCGAKTSAKDVDEEEGQLVLEAIAAIARGEYGIEEHDGGWRFTARRTDPGRPFGGDD